MVWYGGLHHPHLKYNPHVTTWTVEIRVCKLCLQSKALDHCLAHLHKSLRCEAFGCVVDPLNVNSIWLQNDVLVGGAYLEATTAKKIPQIY